VFAPRGGERVRAVYRLSLRYMPALPLRSYGHRANALPSMCCMCCQAPSPRMPPAMREPPGNSPRVDPSSDNILGSSRPTQIVATARRQPSARHQLGPCQRLNSLHHTPSPMMRRTLTFCGPLTNGNHQNNPRHRINLGPMCAGCHAGRLGPATPRRRAGRCQ
jgi:hypothetical protein